MNNARALTASVGPGWEPLSCAGTGDLPAPSASTGFFTAFLSRRLITRRLDFTDLQGLLMLLLNNPSRPLNRVPRGDEKRFRSRPSFLIKPALHVGFPARASLRRAVIIPPVQTGWPERRGFKDKRGLTGAGRHDGLVLLLGFLKSKQNKISFLLAIVI